MYFAHTILYSGHYISTRSVLSYLIHQIKLTMANPYTFGCYSFACEKWAKSLGGLKRHFQSQHPDKEWNPNDGKLVIYFRE